MITTRRWLCRCKRQQALLQLLNCWTSWHVTVR